MNNSTICVYTDGSCLNNGSQSAQGGWSVVIENEVKQLRLSGRESATTNQRMELKAIIEGLKSIKATHKEIHVYTDSAYAKNGCEKWRHDWKRFGWRKKSDKKPVENVDLWKELDALLEERKVRFYKVKGHSGHPQNELADVLAVMASRGTVVKQYGKAGNYDCSWDDES
ncbi:ribonuclease HI [Vibrio fluvialis]|uniref:ribonuclease H family protein n=1 Tax=Vibrio fluvialis TaxID=676 RepID=UPI001EEC50EB|nr:ribonuclease H [Vibrio fluvialis]MCG6341242.1 ribonuclease HI [Vibrio fluvialis]